MMHFTAAQIAALVSGKVIGDAAKTVTGVAKIEEAAAGDLTFLANPKYESYLAGTQAGVVLISEALLKNPLPEKTYITVPDGYAAITVLLAAYEKLQSGQRQKGAEAMSHVSPSAVVAETAWIAAFSYISEGAQVADDVQIFPGCFIGRNVRIGKGTVLHAGVKIYQGCVVGEHCIIHAGAVIGSDGFGFAPRADGSYDKVPQTGIVTLGNQVEVGANTTIDRATMGTTLIGNGVKLDNLIQIAHNVEIGDSTVIAAQAGVSGSTKIGQACMIGGQAGIVGHIHIADGTRINAQSGIAKTISEKGLAFNGTPAFDYTASMKSAAVYRNLPDLQKKIHQLEKQVAALLQSTGSSHS